MRIPSPNKLNYPSSADDLARQEAEAVASGNLEQQNLEKQRNAHRRGERFRELFSLGMYSLFGTIIVIINISVAFVAWHYLTPEEWAWLSDSQLHQLSTFIFSGAVIGAISSYVQRHAW